LSQWFARGKNTCPTCRVPGRLAYIVHTDEQTINSDDEVHVVTDDENDDNDTEEVPLHPVVQSQVIMECIGELMNVSVDNVRYEHGIPRSIGVSIDTPFVMHTRVHFEPDTTTLFHLMYKYRDAKRRRVSLQDELAVVEQEEVLARNAFRDILS